MLLINLFGVPSSGKSTGAAYIFSRLKSAGINAELVTEFAKEKVWEENMAALKNQAYIFGEQYFRISRCKDAVEAIVTDSPLLLSVIYNNDPLLGDSFNDTVAKVANSFRSVNYLVIRNKPYNPSGRLQTEAESDAMITQFIDLFGKYQIDYTQILGNYEGYDEVIRNSLKILRPKTEVM